MYETPEMVEHLYDRGYDSMRLAEYDGPLTTIATHPKNIRSRFAAFDPDNIGKNKVMGSADPRLLAAMAAGSGAGLLAAQRGDTDMIRAPKHGWLHDATMAARGLERRLEGHPASLLYPEGTVNWLERLSYGDKPTWMERGGALLDWL